MKKTNFKVTPIFLMEALNNTNNMVQSVVQNQVIFDKNMSSHLDVLNRIGQAVDKLSEEVKKINGKKDI